jgi:hypothetical protein
MAAMPWPHDDRPLPWCPASAAHAFFQAARIIVGALFLCRVTVDPDRLLLRRHA